MRRERYHNFSYRYYTHAPKRAEKEVEEEHMPKNAEESKSKMRFQSMKKPLRDVSNAKAAIKPTSIHKKISENDEGQAGDDSLDRLLLVHSDLSSLLRQIDELVVQALQLTSNNGRKEIKQFADVLSDTQTSLKPWVSRIEKAVLSQSSTGPENKSKQPMEREQLGVSKESTNTAVESPEETKWESLVSPSPLVSWRAGCHTESGRQLFLLTPLPHKKAFSSKYKASLGTLEKIPSDEGIHPFSLCDSFGNLGNDLHEVASAKPPPKMALDIELTKAAVDNLRTDCDSPEKVSNTNCSRFIMTPCMKMSPPKSCILLEPISAFSNKKSQLVHKSTPFPTGVHSFSDESQDSESSSDQSSDGLKLKYPELYGINKENMQKKMVAEDSPNWIVSPPKTCVIMDPSDNCLQLKTTAVSDQKGDFPTIKTNECECASKKELQGIICSLDLVEFTPMVKEPMSSFRLGKHPGENTLKKELWTRFEAASSHGICFNTSLLQNSTKKGFLDILDEASDA